MSKRIQSILLTLKILMMATAFADAKPCNPAKSCGILYPHDTCRWGDRSVSRSAEFGQRRDRILVSKHCVSPTGESGSFIPQLGSWQCVGSDTLVVTTIGATYFSDQLGDIVLTNHVRYTAKLTVGEGDTLVSGPGTRVFSYFALGADPSDPAAVPVVPPVFNTNTTPFKGIKPVSHRCAVM